MGGLLFGFVSVPAYQRDIGAGAGETGCHGETKSFCASGYQGDLSVESELIDAWKRVLGTQIHGVIASWLCDALGGWEIKERLGPCV